MSAGYSHHHGRFAGGNESNPMPDKNLAHVEFLRRAFRHQTHLMLSHCPVRFVLDAGYLPAVFRPSNCAPKNHDRTGVRVVVRRERIQRLFCD